MDEFLKMDIFFVITTLVVVVLGALVAFALVSVIRILRNVERLSKTVTEEAQLIRSDLGEVRANIKAEGFKWAHVSRLIRASVKRFMSDKGNK